MKIDLNNALNNISEKKGITSFTFSYYSSYQAIMDGQADQMDELYRISYSICY